MPSLDLLRSMAVLLVVVEHTLLAVHVAQIGYWEIRWMGVVGVFMFFVHTSLVLMWSLERNPNVLNFYIRRVFRIYPLAVAALLLIVLFHIPLLQNTEGDAFYRSWPIMHVVSNAMLVQNLGWSGNILGVTWTLPLEIDMYFLLPFLFFFVRTNVVIWPLLCLWVAIVAYARVTVAPDNPTFLVCLPYFLAGVIAYVLFSKVRPRLPAFLLPLFVTALLFGFMAHPTWRSGWLLTLLLGLGLPYFRQIQAKWLIVASHHVAKYSYGIYLAHLFSIAIGFNLLHEYSLTVRIAAIVLSLAVIVVISYHLLEKPMIDLGARLANRADPVT